MKNTILGRKFNLSGILRWFGTLISLGLFIWIVTQQSWGLVFEHIQGITIQSMFGALLFYVISSMFNTWRWCMLLWSQDVDISYMHALQISWAGSFASNFLPSTIGGDGIRIITIYRITKRKTIALGSVILDRIINIVSMIFFVPLPLWMFWGSFDQFTARLSVGLFVNIKELLAGYFSKIIQAYKTWAGKPQVFFYTIFVSLLSNIFFTFATFVMASQLNLKVSVWQVLAIQTVIYFFVMIPVSINAYGVRELAYVVMYTAIGVPAEQASALAFVTRFLMLLATLPGGLWLSKIVTIGVALEDLEAPE